jgi:hypothetical protein
MEHKYNRKVLIFESDTNLTSTDKWPMEGSSLPLMREQLLSVVAFPFLQGEYHKEFASHLPYLFGSCWLYIDTEVLIRNALNSRSVFKWSQEKDGTILEAIIIILKIMFLIIKLLLLK